MTKNGQKMAKKWSKNTFFFTFFRKKKCIFGFAKTTLFFHRFFGPRNVEKFGLEYEQLSLPKPEIGRKKSVDFFGLVIVKFWLQKLDQFLNDTFHVELLESKN